MDSMVRWLTAFLDIPGSTHDAASAFWATTLDGTIGPPRGDQGQFATLEPTAGDPCIRLQRFADGPRVHLDLHVEQPDLARRHAEALGATHVADLGFHIMTTPSGFTFCLVSHDGEATRPTPAMTPHPVAFDTLCLDVPAADFDAELEFWAGMVGLGWRAGEPAEFARIHVAPELPFSLLVQRLGDNDPGPTRAHLDLHCEPDSAMKIATAHTGRGAAVVGEFDGWILMRDPAGLPYCLVTGPIDDPPWTRRAA